MSTPLRDKVTVYTDGGTNPNPGPGGWGVVFLDRQGRLKELSGGEPHTTNNRMELVAAIRALESLKRSCIVDLYTDSQYVRRGITEWLPTWRRLGWKRKTGEIQNLDLWKRLAELTGEHQVRWHWVKGHAGNTHNERADELATREISRHRRPASATDISATDISATDISATEIQVFLKITCRGGSGAWAALVRQGKAEESLTGRLDDTTANQLDLHAATTVLRALPRDSSVAFVTGSDYLRRGAGEWMASWRRRGWKTKEGKPVKNVEGWKRLAVELAKRRVVWPAADDEAAAVLEQLTPLIRDLTKGTRESH